MSSNSKRFTVRFALTKGEGDYPSKSDFSGTEIKDIRNCLEFFIVYDTSELTLNADAKIISVKFLYDGITRYDNEDFGYWFDDDQLSGYPAPIVSFELDKELLKEEFRTAIWSSYFKLKTASMEEAFYAEDHNGYTSILDDTETDAWLEDIDDNEVKPKSKTYEFPDGLPEDGYRFSAQDFARDPQL